MIKSIKLLLPFLLALACGGYDGSADDDNQGDELGQVEQGYQVGLRGGTAQFGTRTAASGLMCDNVSSGQVCLVPKSKAIKVFFTGPTGAGAPSAADIAEVRAQIGPNNGSWFKNLQINGLDASWTFSEATNVNDAAITHVISVDVSAAGFCTGLAGNTETYACFTGTTTGLSEDAGVVGQYVKHTGAPAIHIDLGKIRAKGANAGQDANLLRHASFNVMQRVHGIGQFDGGGNARCVTRGIGTGSAQPTDLLSTACIIQTTEACILNSFTELNDTTHFGLTAVSCGT